jgi:hypothetical protein
VSQDLVYEVFFQEPLFNVIEGGDQIALWKHFLKAFNLTLNDIKTNNQTPSNDLYHFSKMYGRSFLDVSYGLEQVRAGVSNPESRDQVVGFYQGLTESIKSSLPSVQRFTIQEHFAVEGNANDYLQSLNPKSPTSFRKILTATWAGYSLHIPEYKLTMNILVAPSLYRPGGLYLSIQSEFNPVICDFEKSFTLVEEYYSFINKGLQLNVKGF